MAVDPISVASDAPIGEVVRTMAREDIGAVLVVDGEELRGIFTDLDAVKLLAKLLG